MATVKIHLNVSRDTLTKSFGFELNMGLAIVGLPVWPTTRQIW